MFRRFLAALLVALCLATLALWGYAYHRMTLSLNIGSPAVTLVQQTTMPTGYTYVTTDITGVMTMTLPVPSTAGTTLIAVISGVATLGTPAVVTFSTNWTRLATVTETTNSVLEVWSYPTNPGGVTSATATVSATFAASNWIMHLSEWANVKIASALETSGTATATSGTTLAPTTGGNVLTAGDLAISTWNQRLAAPGAVTFTTPGGFTRLADSGASTLVTGHLDIEYEIGPGTGAPLGPTLTSTGTTITAVGAIVVLKPAPPTADQSAYLRHDSLSLKLNTLDFELIDCPVTQQALATVTLSDPGNYPDWTGTISQVKSSEATNIRSGHAVQIITATNTQLPNFTSSPVNLTDSLAGNTTDAWLLENGNYFELENGTGHWLLESATQEVGYTGLSITQQVGSTSPLTLTTIGYVTVQKSAEHPNAVNLWPGMTFKLTSLNQGNWITAPGSLYTIQSITITYHGVPPYPIYEIQFGDLVQTLAQWTAAHA